MPVCDGNYCFTLIDIGEYGSNNDSEVLCRSETRKILSAGEVHLPEPKNLPSSPFDSLSFYLLGEEIYPLKTWLIHLHSSKMLQEDQSVYNYWHSRPRSVIENNFNILVTTWRISNTLINDSLKIVEKYVNAAVVLHNCLRQTENAAYCLWFDRF